MNAVITTRRERSRSSNATVSARPPLTWNVKATSGRVVGPELVNVGAEVDDDCATGDVVVDACAVRMGREDVQAVIAVVATPAMKTLRPTVRSVIRSTSYSKKTDG